MAAVVARMKQRLDEVGKKAPEQSSYFGGSAVEDAMESICASEIKSGYLEPLGL